MEGEGMNKEELQALETKTINETIWKALDNIADAQTVDEAKKILRAMLK